YIENVMTNFRMPGVAMPDFDKRMAVVATEGNYGPIEYFNQVYEYLIHYWGVHDLQPSRTEAMQSKINLLKHYEKLKRIAERLAARNAQ
ncbi:MAG: acyl-ACP desaturase, partial [Clostridia bacterium]